VERRERAGKKGEEKGRGRQVEREGTNVSLFCGSGMYVASLLDRLVVAPSLCSPDLLLRQVTVDTVRRFVCQEVIQSVCIQLKRFDYDWERSG